MVKDALATKAAADALRLGHAAVFVMDNPAREKVCAADRLAVRTLELQAGEEALRRGDVYQGTPYTTPPRPSPPP
ncbi:MAG: hypothetical protein ACOVQL_01350, partial [Limnohabitans sp.]